jgi:glucan phosphoethanolaminetransferase (alkaline phosphatase superfamily)
MNTNKMTTVMKDKKVILSTLWIFALLNYIYADIFNLFFNPEAQSGTMTQGAVFAFAILMETAIAMVLLSRVLKYGVNRWANATSFLYIFCFYRNPLYFVHYLVCMAVAQP